MGKFINLVFSIVLVVSILPVYEKSSKAAEIQNQDKLNQVMVTYKANKEKVKTVVVPTGDSTSDYIEKLQDRPNVAKVEPDYTMHRMVTVNDPRYSKQWYHQLIGTEDAWNVTTGSKDIVVAVIDDGIDLNHRDLMNQITSPYDVVLNSTSQMSLGEHGTHVSGVIAGTMNNGYGGTGIAPNVKIMPINVFDGEEASYSDVITGIDYAINHGAKIINLSLGGTEKSDLLNEAIQRAYKAGILIIAAAGNDGKNVFDYPAAYAHVLAVSATDSSDQIADFSNYGTDIDLAAPGTGIFSTLPNNKFGYLDGTSMATPIVTGVAALVWSANPSLTNTQIEEQLYKTADDLGPTGKDIYYGYGRVNASKAVKVIDKQQQSPILTVHAISDHDTVVTGKLSTIIQNGSLTIYTNDRTLATVQLVNTDVFSLTIPKQLAGTKIYVQVDHPTIYPIEFTVDDQTPPEKPRVNIVADYDTQITGTAEAGSSIKVQTDSGRQLGTAVANDLGKFTVNLNNKPTAGTSLEITATDRAGNTSPVVVATVLDKTPPTTPFINIVTSKTTKVTGKSEPNSIVFVQKNGKTIGSSKASSKGNFSITISKKNANKTIYIYVMDQAKNISKRVTVTF